MSSINNVSPFFGAYNARHINAEEIAHQFVPSKKFWELISLRNSLLIGPRGSGKTHLLKMLQPKALAAWNGVEAESARSRINYWSVFTPADINWKIQVEQKAKNLAGILPEQFSSIVFLSHFREAFVSCLLQLTRDRPETDLGGAFTRIKLPKEKEVELCVALAKSWKLDLGVPSLDGLKLSLVEELSQLGGTSETLVTLSPYMQRMINMNLLGVAREIAENFIAVTGMYSARWALCFDELEIAPPSIQRDLFQYLRSTDQRFVFKLAISPSNDASALLNSEGAASAGNDFDAIPLWFIDHRERVDFCERLWEKATLGTIAEEIPPTEIFQHSNFQYPNSITTHGRRRYNKQDGWGDDFIELEKKDYSFSEYLKRQGINTNSLNLTPTDKMNSVVRKIAPIVGFRNAYFADRSKTKGIPERSSIQRAPVTIFSGWEAICTATEGNPRWFSAIASRLILKIDSSQRVSALSQTQELEISGKKFLAWIHAIPLSNFDGPSVTISLFDFIKALASFFEDSILGKKFVADPVLAFTVDSETPESIKRLVMAALNIGAIVIVDDEEVNFTAADPVGRTFRLVHLLAPYFSLPMRRGKARSLTTILGRFYGSIKEIRLRDSSAFEEYQVLQLGLFR